MKQTWTIDINPEFRPFPHCPQIPVQRLDYPSGCEPHVRLGGMPEGPSLVEQVLITVRPRSMDDVFRAMAASNAWQDINLKMARTKLIRADLFIPFFPHARQDRIAVYGDACSLQVVVDMIAKHFGRVYVFDPHSSRTTELLRAGQAPIPLLGWGQFFDDVVIMESAMASHMAMVLPDAGAAIRPTQHGFTRQFLHPDDRKFHPIRKVYFTKKRNPRTGKLEFIPPEDAPQLTGHTCIIVDDICDGGGTFIPIAKHLRELGAQRVVLAVSHGIFSKGLDVLKPYIDHIHCTNSFRDIDDAYVTQHTNWPRLLREPFND